MNNQSNTFRLLILFITLFTIGFGSFSPELAALPRDKNRQASLSPFQPQPVFQKRFILIDAGHGGIDGGTSYRGILEKDINLAIAHKLYVLLKNEGIPVILNRTGDYALSEENRWSVSRSRHHRDLAQRHQLSEEIPIELYISLHVNWGKKTSTQGAVVLHQEEGRSYMLAEALQQQLNRLHGQRAYHIPETGNKYYLLRKVKQPAVIIETGFISNPIDRELLTSSKGQSLIAEHIKDAIVYYLRVM